MATPPRSISPDLAWKLGAIATVAVVLAVPALTLLSGPGDDPLPAQIVASEGTWEMAEMCAPTLRFSAAERAFPAPVEYFIERSALVDAAGTVALEHPGMDELEGAGYGQFLDFQGDAIGSYERDRAEAAPTVYARVGEVGGRIIVQYWMFYVYNQGSHNSHEGDWEMVQVVMAPDGPRPEQLVLSQHHGGSLVDWGALTGSNGPHPIILVAAGSHANYLPGNGQRAIGDHADGLGDEWGLGDYDLVPIGTGAGGDEPSWLRFSGHWGEPAGGLGGLLGREGPPGPQYREGGRMWSGAGWWS